MQCVAMQAGVYRNLLSGTKILRMRKVKENTLVAMQL